MSNINTRIATQDKIKFHSHMEERYTVTKIGDVYSVSGKDDGTGISKIIINAFGRWWELPSVDLDTTLNGINSGNVGGATSGNKIYAFWNDAQTQFIGYGLLTTTENPASVYKNYKELVWFNYSVPIGSIIAWHKSFTNTPPLSDNWVECNGQVLSDSASDFDGQTIPDLNGDARFLRGSDTSGTEQADAFQGHGHILKFAYRTATPGPVGGYNYWLTPNGTFPITSPDYPMRAGYHSDGTNGTPRVDDETRPVNMSVVWIIRVK